jgi:hypothetical protein
MTGDAATAGREPAPPTEPAYELTSVEEDLLAHAVAGEPLDLRDEAHDVSDGARWGPDRTVRADVLVALATGALGTVHRRGVRLVGGRIQGTVDLSWSEVAQPLSLVECYLDDPFRAEYARWKALALTGSRLGSLDLSRARLEGGLFLDQGFSATGEVRLLGAEVGGQLSCRGATLSNAGGDALNADRATINGGVLLDLGFSATGEVRLLGAEVGGQLSCRGATLSNDDRYALSADGATIKGGVFLDQGFSAVGEVRLVGAEVGSQLSCRGATLSNAGGGALSADRATVKGEVFLDQGFSATGEVRLLGAEVSGQLNCRGATLSNTGGDALSADGATVKGGVFLDQGFAAVGVVRLLGAVVGGQLSCRGATLSNNDGYALNADGATVKGDVVLDQGFSATGEIRLPGAEVGGQLNCRGATLSNDGGYPLNAEGATVKGGVFLDQGFSATGEICLFGADVGVLLWDDEHADGILDLREATARQLADRWAQLIKMGARLSGFRYESFVEGTDDSLGLRLAWVRSSPDYSPHPYTQLAAVYRGSGHDDRARKVLIAREVDRRNRSQASPVSKAKSLFLGATMAHGYHPARAVVVLILLWLSGVALLWGDAGHRAMVATKATAQPASSAAAPPTALSCPPRYPCFNP